MYYLQSPEISLYADGKWDQNNIIIGKGIITIIAILVNEEGLKQFEQKVKDSEWGQFNKLPDGTKKLSKVDIKN